MSTIMFPVGSETGRPAPMAAAIGSSIRYAARAPAESVASSTARFSTPVTPLGTHHVLVVDVACLRSALRQREAGRREQFVIDRFEISDQIATEIRFNNFIDISAIKLEA